MSFRHYYQQSQRFHLGPILIVLILALIFECPICSTIALKPAPRLKCYSCNNLRNQSSSCLRGLIDNDFDDFDDDDNRTMTIPFGSKECSSIDPRCFMLQVIEFDYTVSTGLHEEETMEMMGCGSDFLEGLNCLKQLVKIPLDKYLDKCAHVSITTLEFKTIQSKACVADLFMDEAHVPKSAEQKEMEYRNYRRFEVTICTCEGTHCNDYFAMDHLHAGHPLEVTSTTTVKFVKDELSGGQKMYKNLCSVWMIMMTLAALIVVY